MPEQKHKSWTIEYLVVSAGTIGALEKQLNDHEAKDFHLYNVFVTSKDQFVAVFHKDTEHEIPTDEDVNALTGGATASVGGPPSEKKNA